METAPSPYSTPSHAYILSTRFPLVFSVHSHLCYTKVAEYKPPTAGRIKPETTQRKTTLR